MKNNYRYLNYVGDSSFENRFATKDEMASMLTKLDISDPNVELSAAGLPLLSDTKTIYADTQDYHSLILGSTGSMKTRTLILPTIFSLAMAGENIVVSDPKGELYEHTSRFLKDRGYDINVLNLRDMEHSDCWNPLAEAYALFHKGEEELGLNLAHEFINAVTARVQDSKSPSWALSARQLLGGLCELMIRGAKDESECNPGSLSILLDRTKVANEEPEGHSKPWSFGEDDDEPSVRSFLEFVNALPEGCSLKNGLFSAVNMTRSATVTLAGILDNAYAAVSAFTSSRLLMRLTSRTSFDIHDLAAAERKHAIFLIVPDEDTTFHFVVSSFIKQLYTTMIKESYLRGGSLPRRLNFILDEFANLPKIADMPSMITAARSRNMRFFLVVQSDSQLHATYKEDAETIKTNCLNWVYLSTKEDQLIQQIMRMVGVRGNGSDQPLITYQELSSMRKVIGEKGGVDALVLMNRARPYVSFMPDISRYRQFETGNPVELPHMDGEYKSFDLVKDALSLPEEEANRIYGGISLPKAEPTNEPEAQEKPEASEANEKAKNPYEDLLKKLDEIDDNK